MQKRTEIFPPRLSHESHESIYLPLPHHLRQISDNMGLRDFLGIPKRHRRKHSKARSEIGPTEGTDEVDPAPLARLTLGSTPDLQLGVAIPTSPGPSTVRGQRSNGMHSAILLDHLSDHSFLHNAEPTSISDRFRSILSKRQSKPTGPSNPTVETSAGSESKLDWKTTTSSAAKLLLLGVRESADAFGPLKSVAGGLCFILENCDVRTFFYTHCSQRSRVNQRTKANKQLIESLAPRIRLLAQSLCAPVHQDDIKEQSRRDDLEQLDNLPSNIRSPL